VEQNRDMLRAVLKIVTNPTLFVNVGKLFTK